MYFKVIFAVTSRDSLAWRKIMYEMESTSVGTGDAVLRKRTLHAVSGDVVQPALYAFQ